jgi:hypothetical protein
VGSRGLGDPERTGDTVNEITVRTRAFECRIHRNHCFPIYVDTIFSPLPKVAAEANRQQFPERVIVNPLADI